jgi:hypothetical protein
MKVPEVCEIGLPPDVACNWISMNKKRIQIYLLNFMICYIFSFVTKLSNLLTVSSIDVSDSRPRHYDVLLENSLQIDLHQSPLGTE